MNYDIIYANLVQVIGRTLHWKQDLKDDGKGYDGVTKPLTMDDIARKWNPRNTISGTSNAAPDPNLISSALPNGNHAPAIDMDLPIHAIPSSTPGHFHLYIDKEMSWKDYEKLLKVMSEVGIVEKGFYEQTCKFKQSYLRLPYVKKGQK